MAMTKDPSFRAAILHDDDGNPISSVLDGVTRRLAVDASVSSSTISGVSQEQTVETTTPLGASATFDGTAHDMITDERESISYSIFMTGGGVGTTVDVVMRHSADGVTYREFERTTLDVPAGIDASFVGVYSTSRRFMRVQLINNSVNALAVTEVVSVKKALS